LHVYLLWRFFFDLKQISHVIISEHAHEALTLLENSEVKKKIKTVIGDFVSAKTTHKDQFDHFSQNLCSTIRIKKFWSSILSTPSVLSSHFIFCLLQDEESRKRRNIQEENIRSAELKSSLRAQLNKRFVF